LTTTLGKTLGYLLRYQHIGHYRKEVIKMVGIKETREVLACAKELKELTGAILRKDWVSIAWQAKDVVNTIGPAIDDVEKVWKEELVDLDAQEIEILRGDLNEIAGRELINDEWMGYGLALINFVKVIIDFIKQVINPE
jgi:hypothetical protein